MRRCFHVGALEYALNGREFGTSDDVGPPPLTAMEYSAYEGAEYALEDH